MRISDWSSDVCSSDLENTQFALALRIRPQRCGSAFKNEPDVVTQIDVQPWMLQMVLGDFANGYGETIQRLSGIHAGNLRPRRPAAASVFKIAAERVYFVERSEEHTSELQSLMRISYAVFCLKKKNNTNNK